MNITLQVAVIPPTHDLSYDVNKEAARTRRGDIIGVYLTADVPEAPNPVGRLGFVHITNVPDAIPFERIKERLISAISNPISASVEMWRKRKWRISASTLPAAVRSTLLDDKEITVTWEQAKLYIRKKIVLERANASVDDETTELNDADLA